MKRNELKRRLDDSANYKWVKNGQDSWRLVNSFTLKTALGVEDRYSAEMLTRRLKAEGYSVEDVPHHPELDSVVNTLQTAATAILLLAGPLLWLLEVYGIF